MPTTPKMTAAELEAELRAVDARRATAEAVAEERGQRIDNLERQITEMSASRVPDEEAEIISNALRAITKGEKNRRDRGYSGLSISRPGVDYERVLRYLAQRLGVRWPDAVAPQTIEVEVYIPENILAHSTVTFDVASASITRVDPPVPYR